MKIRGQIVDPDKRETYYGEIIVEEGIITRIHRLEGEGGHYIMPGFIDAHIHIESSMLVPSEFARLAPTQRTVNEGSRTAKPRMPSTASEPIDTSSM